jgi:hypothetical protein
MLRGFLSIASAIRGGQALDTRLASEHAYYLTLIQVEVVVRDLRELVKRTRRRP